ncbi:MlaD family protein [Colwelliaceae bacterium 6441]
MTDINNNQPPKAFVTRKEGISAIWIVPIIALIFGSWLIIKAVAERGTFITVQFDNASGIIVGKTEVRYKGLPTGKVTAIEVSEDLQSVIVEIEMVASAKKMLTDKTLFWAVNADISFQGVSGLDTLLSGSYINVQPHFNGDGESQRHFIALSEPPILSEETPGLHITLQTERLGSLGRNSPVSFKQITVGHVSGYQFDSNSGKVNIKVFIEPRYAQLVKENSRFWNASGFEISGSLTSNINVKTESVASIVAGGIAFDNAKHEAILHPARNGQKYTLYSDFQSAEMGHEIELILNWNADIGRGTDIIYQGLKLGTIESLSTINPETRKITALARVTPRAIPYLTSQTQFFVVTPQVDLGGVTNLETLLKGSHVSLRPSLKGEPKKQFSVFNHKPAYHYDEPGLHLVLKASQIDSLKVGTGVFYKKQRVGAIQAINNHTSNTVFVHIHIEEKYQDFVTQHSHFWNTSGIKITGGLQDFEIQANSIQSLLTGGIEFDSPTLQQSITVKNGDEYRLFNNKTIAKQRVNFQLTTSSLKGLTTKTRIIFKGETIGSIHHITRHENHITLDVGILPNFEFLLKEQSQFWLVKPTISISGLSDTEALFGGTYIAVNAGGGATANNFQLTDIPPAKHISAQGLQLSLHTKRGNVVSPGSPISFHGILVGQVDNVALNDSGEGVNLNITIDEKYRHLVNHFTRFYNASGITISGGLGNLLVKTESADSVLRGGISFFNPKNKQAAAPLKEGENFQLFHNIEHAEMAGIAIKIHFNDVAGLKSNLPIKYQDQPIGVVSRVDFDDTGFGATVYAFLNDSGRKFAVEGTQFWLAKTELGLVGTKNVSAIIDGGFIGVLPGKGNRSSSFIAKDTPPVVTQLPYGLNIKLQSTRLGSIRVGNPVLYRQVKVGNVIGVDLSSMADKVNIYINIVERYAPLVTSASKFWNSSGFSVDAGVFSGVNIDSESIETLLSGGVAFATPEGDMALSIKQGDSFTLYNDAQNNWLKWQPKISLNE